MFVPGYWALGPLLFHEEWARFEIFKRLAIAWALSGVLFSTIEAGALIFPAPLIRFFDLGIIVTCFGVLLTKSRAIIAGATAANWGAKAFVLLFCILLLLFFIPAPIDYPGVMTAGYGDLPAYYRVAHNIASGARPLIDFRVGDYVNEKYTIPLSYPFPTFLIAFFMSVFPNTNTVLSLVCTGSGLIAIFFIAEKFRASYLWRIAAIAGLLALNGLAYHLVLGAVILPAALFLILASHFMAKRTWMACTIFLSFGLLSRPEAALLLFLSGSMKGLVKIARHSPVNGALNFFGTGAVLFLVGWIVVPHLTPSRGVSVSYISYDKAAGFRWTDTKWYVLNEQLIRRNLGIWTADSFNPEIYREIHRHPFQFTAFAVREVLQSDFRSLLFLVIAMLAISGWLFTPFDLAFALAMVLYFPILFCINRGSSERHFLLVSLLTATQLLASGNYRPWVRHVWQSKTSFFWFLKRKSYVPISLIIAVIFARSDIAWALRGVEAIQLSRQEEHRSLFAELKKLSRENDLVASSCPQLVSYMADRHGVGNSDLYWTLEPLIQREWPDLVVIDDVRDGPRTYSLFMKSKIKPDLQKYGYQIAADRPDEHFIIFKRR